MNRSCLLFLMFNRIRSHLFCLSRRCNWVLNQQTIIRDFEVFDTILPGRSPLHAPSSFTIGDPTLILNNINAPPVIPASQLLYKTSAPNQPAVNHFVLNLTPEAFSNIQPLASLVSSSKVNARSSVPVRVTSSVPYSSGGTVYYVPPVQIQLLCKRMLLLIHPRL